MKVIFTVFHFENCNTLSKLFLLSCTFFYFGYLTLIPLPRVYYLLWGLSLGTGSVTLAGGWVQYSHPQKVGQGWRHQILLPLISEIANVHACEKAHQNQMLASEILALEYEWRSAAAIDMAHTLWWPWPDSNLTIPGGDQGCASWCLYSLPVFRFHLQVQLSSTQYLLWNIKYFLF